MKDRRLFSNALAGERAVAPVKCLARQEDQQVIEFLQEYFTSLTHFSGDYYRFKSEQNVQYESVDSLIENHLFYLRQVSTNLFQEPNQVCERKTTPEEKLLDLIIGSIFHELLRLKQYLYILHKHRAQVTALEQSVQAQYFLLSHGRAMVREAEMKLPGLMEEIRELWEEGNMFLHEWLPRFSNNKVISRFLFRNQLLIDRAYGYQGFENLLNHVFEYGAEDGFYQVGMDYCRSCHRREASDCFHRLLELYERRDEQETNELAKPLPKKKRLERLKETRNSVQQMLVAAQRLNEAEEKPILEKLLTRLGKHLSS